MQKKQHTKDVFPIVKRAVNEMVDFIRPTFGPTQNKVMIGNDFGAYAIDDGVKIAREFEVEDAFENAIVGFVKAASRKTNDRAGDGTTGSMILLQAIINGMPDFFDSFEYVTELKAGMAEATRFLAEKSRKISTLEELRRVAEISCNDPKLAGMISEMVFKIGSEGSLFIEEGKELETKYRIIEGLQFGRGFVHASMAMDQTKHESAVDDAKILLIDKRLVANDLVPFFNKLVREENRKLLLVAEDFDEGLVELIIKNNYRGSFNVIAVRAPGFATRSEELKDIAFLTGTEVFDNVNKLESVEYAKLGNARKVIVTPDTCTIVSDGGDAQKRIEQLRNAKADSEFDQVKIKERIAKLQNGVAFISVGGLTEEEVIATKEKVEDAVNATKLAFKGGVVRGAGQELAGIETSSKVLNAALRAPAAVLRENVGKDFVVGEDIFDPTDVLIAALESAVSVACMLISTKGLFTRNAIKDDTDHGS